MGLTGLVFAGIAAAWLVYLVPYFLHRRGDLQEESPADVPFTPAVTIVRSGTSLAEADPGAATVSTPLTRRAQLRELHLRDLQAAQRRRRVLIFLLLAQVIVGGLAIFRIGAWWGALIPAGLIVAFLVVARFSVRTMRADLARRAGAIRECPDEETVAITLTAEDVAEHEHSIELSVPVAQAVSLWDPIPITRPTYVSKPLAPRTVRTIDLSAPVPTPGRIPVTADPIEPPTAEPDAQEDAG
ncbi:MAG: hypothetical protein QM779_09435 [Propionicimonas sp.]|uniref:hypothetical protein n=1 Tax=Propionicimonas sp. TaxID=1955623 RepID=UPI003D13B6AE